MDLVETAELLAIAGAYDGREVVEANVRAWQALLVDVDAVVAKRAVLAHYRVHPWRIMPSHVLDAVEAAHATLPALNAYMEYPAHVVGDQAAERAYRAANGITPRGLPA